MSTFYHFAESDVDDDTLLQMSIDGSMEQLASVGLESLMSQMLLKTLLWSGRSDLLAALAILEMLAVIMVLMLMRLGQIAWLIVLVSTVTFLVLLLLYQVH